MVIHIRLRKLEYSRFVRVYNQSELLKSLKT